MMTTTSDFTRQKSTRSSGGFTIVELLIVIVVIGILAAITIVAYNGIQSRARDSIRYADAKAIVKALEIYKADKGYYPQWDANNTTTAALCAGHTNGYSYSDATDGTWLKSLVIGNAITKVPTAPSNGCTSYYRYLYPGATTYNCPARTTNYYILEIVGVESMATPADASDPSDGSNWKPCPAATAGWGAGAAVWVFTKDE
jgi:prepilin-type N-terminal cleavage/methylation domain-containing protein